MIRARHKYGAKRQICGAGHDHASKREAARCDQLRLLEKAGKIVGLQFEPAFYFVIDGREVKHDKGRRVGYKPDFSYIENGVKVCEDVKSRATVTEAFVLRAAIFRHLYPSIELRVIT